MKTFKRTAAVLVLGTMMGGEAKAMPVLTVSGGILDVAVAAKGSMTSGNAGAYGRTQLAFLKELYKKTLDLKLTVARELDTARPAGKQYDTTMVTSLSLHFGK